MSDCKLPKKYLHQIKKEDDQYYQVFLSEKEEQRLQELLKKYPGAKLTIVENK